VGARLSRLVRAGLAVGPQIVIAAGIVFFLGMVGFLLFVPLPPPVVPVATRVFDRNGELVASLFAENRIPVNLADVPEILQQGIVTIEDDRFYRHRGIDPIALGRAIWRNLRAGRVVEGGSTITAQVARTLYLTQEVTLTRKVVEALLALKLERTFTKQEILELYLNQIYLGNGAYGVEVASRTFFGKETRDLTLAESAMIAGLPASPENFSPYNHPERAVRRRNLVLDVWAARGLITPEQAAEAKEEEIVLAAAGPPMPVGTYFTDYVLAQIREVQDRLPVQVVPMSDLLVGGYHIYTSLDVRMQRAAEEAIRDFMPDGQPDATGVRQPQVALVAIDPTNGHILAMAGGRSFPETQLNRAVPPGAGRDGMRRQPGSAFKPFLYAAVLANNFPLLSTQVCEPVDYPAGGGARYRPTDYGREPYHNRPMTIREAIRISDNVVAVRWAARIGVAQMIRFARLAGIESPLEANLSLALGSSEVSVLEMARAYATFANGGFRVEPLAFLRMEDRYGARVPGIVERRPIIERAIDERVAYLVNRLLQEPFRSRGTAVHLLHFFNRPVAGKTGTTDNQHDAWFIGYTPQIVCAVWVGNDSPANLGGYGGTLAGPVWANFMAKAHPGLGVVDWEEPPGIVTVEVCATTGLLPNLTCPTVSEIYLEGTEPRRRHATPHQVTETEEGTEADAGLESPYGLDGFDWPGQVEEAGGVGEAEDVYGEGAGLPGQGPPADGSDP
jgi:1A family penicillin-binding protein